jgi:hypothetical protein
MNIEKDNLKKKYIKYKYKYLNLTQKLLLPTNNILYGGINRIPTCNDISMLFFIKDIIKKNAELRFSEKIDYEPMIEAINSVTNICNFEEDKFKKILSKGYDRLYRLIKYITSNKDFLKKSNNYKALIVAQFIIINQLFGDANHRTALYVLDQYSNYTIDDKKIIMTITERIHNYKGDLKYLWEGIEADKKPNFEKLESIKDFSKIILK